MAKKRSMGISGTSYSIFRSWKSCVVGRSGAAKHKSERRSGFSDNMIFFIRVFLSCPWSRDKGEDIKELAGKKRRPALMISCILSERVSVKASEQESSSSPYRLSGEEQGMLERSKHWLLDLRYGKTFLWKSLTKFNSPWKGSANEESPFLGAKSHSDHHPILIDLQGFVPPTAHCGLPLSLSRGQLVILARSPSLLPFLGLVAMNLFFLCWMKDFCRLQ